MQGPDGTIYASAQGPLATGGYDLTDRGLTHIKKNHVLVGRIPDGAIVQREYSFNLVDGRDLSLSLHNPDFTSALSLSKAINAEFADRITSAIAKPVDAATVVLDYSAFIRDSIISFIPLVEFISMVENLKFEVASQAKVVINERTGP
jgi:flagellar P-ring protein precursor FlgI